MIFNQLLEFLQLMSSLLSVISVGEITLMPHYHSFHGQGQCKKKVRENTGFTFIK